MEYEIIYNAEPDLMALSFQAAVDNAVSDSFAMGNPVAEWIRTVDFIGYMPTDIKNFLSEIKRNDYLYLGTVSFSSTF